MGRQRAEESLNSFNAAPPLSDARLSPFSAISVGAVSSQQEVKDHTFLKTGWAAGGVPPKSSIAIIPEIAQRTLLLVGELCSVCRILAAIWETVALFGWLATLPSTLFSFVHASLRPFYHLCSSSPPFPPTSSPPLPRLVSRCEIAICSQNSLIGLRIIDGCGGGRLG